MNCFEMCGLEFTKLWIQSLVPPMFYCQLKFTAFQTMWKIMRSLLFSSFMFSLLMIWEYEMNKKNHLFLELFMINVTRFVSRWYKMMSDVCTFLFFHWIIICFKYCSMLMTTLKVSVINVIMYYIVIFSILES